MSFQTTHLKSDCEPLTIAVPKCFYSKYKSGFSDAPHDGNVSPEPPESILVLQDMRPLGFKVGPISLSLYLPPSLTLTLTH